jgi:hypothetical protein
MIRSDLTSCVNMVLTEIKLDNRITHLRTAVERVGSRKGWSPSDQEQIRTATAEVITEYQPHILRTMRSRSLEHRKKRGSSQ